MMLGVSNGTSHDRNACTLLGSANASNKTVQLFLSQARLIAQVFDRGSVTVVNNHLITGIPRQLLMNYPALRQYLALSGLTLIPTTDNGVNTYAIRFFLKLPGGVEKDFKIVKEVVRRKNYAIVAREGFRLFAIMESRRRRLDNFSILNALPNFIMERFFSSRRSLSSIEPQLQFYLALAFRKTANTWEHFEKAINFSTKAIENSADKKKASRNLVKTYLKGITHDEGNERPSFGFIKRKEHWLRKAEEESNTHSIVDDMAAKTKRKMQALITAALKKFKEDQIKFITQTTVIEWGPLFELGAGISILGERKTLSLFDPSEEQEDVNFKAGFDYGFIGFSSTENNSGDSGGKGEIELGELFKIKMKAAFEKNKSTEKSNCMAYVFYKSHASKAKKDTLKADVLANFKDNFEHFATNQGAFVVQSKYFCPYISIYLETSKINQKQQKEFQASLKSCLDPLKTTAEAKSSTAKNKTKIGVSGHIKAEGFKDVPLSLVKDFKSMDECLTIINQFVTAVQNKNNLSPTLTACMPMQEKLKLSMDKVSPLLKPGIPTLDAIMAAPKEPNEP